MRIYGLDFTSAPSSKTSKAKKLKRLMLAVTSLICPFCGPLNSEDLL